MRGGKEIRSGKKHGRLAGRLSPRRKNENIKDERKITLYSFRLQAFYIGRGHD